MSVLTFTKPIKEQSKVHNSQYIKTENKPDEETKPSEPVNPDKSGEE
jgi:hypothetical protein